MSGSYNPINQGNTNLASAGQENKGIFNRLLRNLSSFGMKYDDMIMRNQVGIGINEDPLAQKNNSMYDFISSRAVAQVLTKKSIPYLDKAYPDKKRILREYSIKDEIRDYIATVADECIIFNGQNFCEPKTLSNNYSNEIKDKFQEFFEKLYNKYGFSDGITAWNYMKDFLIDGYLALEIIWDDKKENIIAFNRLAAETLVPSYEISLGNCWTQYPEDPKLKRILFDSQIIFISYDGQNAFSGTSYVEGLIKPYNQLKMIEQSLIMFNINNATTYKKFTIPTKGLSKSKAEEQIGQLIANYSENIEWDDSLGTLSINGSKQIPYNKQIWFPDSDFGTPNVEVLPNGHPNVNANYIESLDYFNNLLKMASKFPNEGNIKEERRFNIFTLQLKSKIKEIVLKALLLQIETKYPVLRNNIFLKQILISL